MCRLALGKAKGGRPRGLAHAVCMHLIEGGEVSQIFTAPVFSHSFLMFLVVKAIFMKTK